MAEDIVGEKPVVKLPQILEYNRVGGVMESLKGKPITTAEIMDTDEIRHLVSFYDLTKADSEAEKRFNKWEKKRGYTFSDPVKRSTLGSFRLRTRLEALMRNCLGSLGISSGRYFEYFIFAVKIAKHVSKFSPNQWVEMIESDINAFEPRFSLDRETLNAIALSTAKFVWWEMTQTG